MAAVKVILDTAPEPITLAEAKSWLEIEPDFTAKDHKVLSCIKTARRFCEEYRGLSFKPRTLQTEVPYTNRGYQNLPKGPVKAVTNVTNSDGIVIVSDAVLGSTWIAEYLKGMSINNTWKEDYWGFNFGFNDAYDYLSSYTYTVTYEAGFTAEELPENYKMAIQKMVVDLYENPGNTNHNMTVVAVLPLGSKELLDVDRERVFF